MARFHPKLNVLSAVDTNAIILDSGLTGRGWERLNANLRHLGAHVPFAPRAQVERLRRNDEIKCQQQLILPLVDKHGMLCKSAVLVQDCHELFASDLDRASSQDALLLDFALRSDTSLNNRHLMISQDKGSTVVKFVIKPIGVKLSQSVTWARLFASYEPWHRQQKTKPADVLTNWKVVLAYVHGFYDLQFMSVVQIGKGPSCRHALVPTAALPSNGLLTFVQASIADISALDKHRSGERNGTPKEMEELRASAIAESAVLVNDSIAHAALVQPIEHHLQL